MLLPIFPLGGNPREAANLIYDFGITIDDLKAATRITVLCDLAVAWQVVFQMAEVAVPPELFQAILEGIGGG
ncbi:MAG: hypothetical protein ABSE16_07925 [Verrucomicrobiota bacterium]|jgi:hypothetical protein